MAKVLTGISGNVISAASAAFAPTNSADVSAIASAYQVVSSTAIRTLLGDDYLGFVNELPISASRATYAGQAGFDGAGRLLSALPDSATVSAIASAYAESAASSKLDATASSQFLTSIPSDYATTAYVDSSISGFAYESAVSAWTAKQDPLTFGYNTANQISSIDGSALAGPESFSQQQLDYLKRALGVDETVLWSGTAGVVGDTLTLTEAYSNFEKIEIYAKGVYQSSSTIYTFAIVSGVTDFRFSNMSCDGSDTYEWVCRIAIDSTTGFSVGRSLILKQAHAGSSRSSSNASTTGSFPIAIKKIVGIHRIAGGN